MLSHCQQPHWQHCLMVFLALFLAWVLVRYDFPGRKLLDAAVDLPFALPTSVAGLTLATVYNPQNGIGKALTSLGIQVLFTRWGVAIAMVFVSFPFVVRTVQPVLQDMEVELEEVAWSLGALSMGNLLSSVVPISPSSVHYWCNLSLLKSRG